MNDTADDTEEIREHQLVEINITPHDTRADMETRYGKVWDTDELQRDFHVLSFLAPFVLVQRKSDDKKGTLEFTHSPRWYWGFTEAYK